MKVSTRLLRIAGKVLLWLVCILVVVRVAVPVAGVAVANRVLPGILGTAASIESLDMVLSRGRASVGGIDVFQPKGFDGGPLFSLGEASVNVSLPSIRKGPLTVESVTVDRLVVNLIRNDTNAPIETKPEVEDETGEPASPMAVAVEKLTVRDLTFSYRDLTYDPPLVAHVAECNIGVTDILFDPAHLGESPLDAAAILTASLKQPGFHDAYVGLTARLGILTTNPPPVAAAARVVGLELKSGLDAVVPPGVVQTLGGSCVDAYVDLAMAMDVLDVRCDVKTEDNTMSIAVGGTPLAPKVDKSTTLFNLISRPGALVGGVVTDVGSAGVEVVEGAAKTTAAVGLGALKVVGSVGKGVLKTAKGVATADLSDIGDGLKTATVGTVTETAEALVDTATTAVEGVGDSATAAIGKDDTDAWRDGCRQRWDQLWEEACVEIEAAPYPRPKGEEAQPAEDEQPVEEETPPAEGQSEPAAATNEPVAVSESTD